MSELEIRRLRAEILLMKWHQLRKYFKLQNAGHVQRDLVDDIENGLRNLARREDGPGSGDLKETKR